MKKLLAFLFVLTCTIGVFAEKVEIDGIYYELREEQSYDESIGNYVSSYSATVTYKDDANEFVNNSLAYKGSIEIPSSIVYDGNTYTVDCIGYSAFRKCMALSNVTIPETVKTIDGEAFRESGLRSIEIPSSVERIDGYVFYRCALLSSVVLPEGMTNIPYAMFSTCELLKSINIPSSVEIIGSSAFYACSSLTTVELHEGLTSIDFDAFHYCQSLNNIILPSTLVNLGVQCFGDCYSLKTITIPEGIMIINTGAFRYCHKLESVVLPQSLISIGNDAFINCRDLKSLELPSELMAIGVGAFRDCNSLKEVTIPESVGSIGNEAFDGCTNLIVYNNSGVDFVCNDGSVRVFTDYAADGDFVFNHISTSPVLAQYNGTERDLVLPGTYNGSVYTIGNGAFYNNMQITSVVFPDDCTKIGNNAFEGCRNLASLTLPSNLVSIGARAFQYCNSLKEISLPSTLTSIGEYAFYDCGNLKTVYNYSALNIVAGEWESYGFVASWADNVYKDVYTTDDFIFTDASTDMPILAKYIGSPVATLVLPESANGKAYILADRAFSNDTTLTKVVLPEKLIRIGNYSFSGCTKLREVAMPADIQEIGYEAFAYCSNLTAIELSNNIGQIGEGAFRGCGSLSEIHLPSALKRIENNTFYECLSLEKAVLPSELQYIGDQAFRWTALREITLPSTLTYIGWAAFDGCGNLKTVYNNSSLDIHRGQWEENGYVAAHADYVFNDIYVDGDFIFSYSHTNPELTLYTGVEANEITLPNSVDGKSYTIAPSAFRNHAELTKVVISDNVTEIGSEAFADCTSLKEVTFGNGINAIEDYAFYRTAIQELDLPGSIEDIGVDAFAECGVLKTVILEDGIRIIRNGAFRDCAIENVVMPNSIEEIGENAFRSCYSLREIKFSEKIRRIGNDAFSGCPIGNEFNIGNNIEYIGSNAFNNCSGAIHIGNSSVCELGENPFHEYVTLLVPYGYVDAYRNSWPKYKWNIIADGYNEFDVTVNALEDDSDLFRKVVGNNPEDFAYNVTKLKVSGTINSYDILSIRNKFVNLRYLDLGDAKIVNSTFGYYDEHCTQEDVVGDNMFRNLYRLNTIILPKDVASIGYNAFNSCYNLYSVTLPPNLKSIGGEAFESCGFSHIELPTTLESIGSYAFAWNGNLKSINLPQRLKTIEYYAFGGTGLEEVAIPPSVVYIGDYAFDTDRVKRIYTWTIAPTNIRQTTFNARAYEDATLYVPESSQKLYSWNTQWSQFRSITTFNEPYEYFYLEDNDLRIDNETVRIEGEGSANPDADFSQNAGLIIEGDAPQSLGEVNIDSTTSLIATDTEQPNISIDRLVININIQQDRWYFFCFPFNVPKSNIFFNGQFQWCYYDGEYRAEHGSGAWRDAEGDLEAYKGYIFMGSKDGVLSISVESVALDASDAMIALESYPSASADDASWNLVGNPFTSYYNLGDLGYNAPITFWNPESGSYEAYNPMDDDILLYPYQAFFVQKTNDDGGIDFESEYQSTYLQSQDEETQMAAKRRRIARNHSNVERFVCNVELSDGIHSDRTRVVFNEESLMDYEIGRDAAKFMSNQIAQIYTLDSKNVYYSINERPMAEGVVRLGIAAVEDGTFTISASRLDTPLYLIDLLTGESIDLSVDSYSFDMEHGSENNRMVLSTEPELTGLQDINADDDSDAIYYDLRGINRGHDMPAGISIRHDGQKRVKLAE